MSRCDRQGDDGGGREEEEGRSAIRLSIPFPFLYVIYIYIYTHTLRSVYSCTHSSYQLRSDAHVCTVKAKTKVVGVQCAVQWRPLSFLARLTPKREERVREREIVDGTCFRMCQQVHLRVVASNNARIAPAMDIKLIQRFLRPYLYCRQRQWNDKLK